MTTTTATRQRAREPLPRGVTEAIDGSRQRRCSGCQVDGRTQCAHLAAVALGQGGRCHQGRRCQGRACGLDIRRCRGEGLSGGRQAELLDRVGEKAHGACALGTLTAQLGAKLVLVHPEFEHAMGIGARVPALADALAKLRAGHGSILVHSRITTACLFTRVGKGAVGPVVHIAALTFFDLGEDRGEMVRDQDEGYSSRDPLWWDPGP